MAESPIEPDLLGAERKPTAKPGKGGLFSFRHLLFGRPLNPMDTGTRHKLLLAAFLAWVGLGADGLSSANYGPAEAYMALGVHTGFGIFVALAIVATVFVIALGYNQVIELFPTGGGGYRVATRLLGPYAGLLGGTALIIDYVLTITISIASGVDALYSLLPLEWHATKMPLAGGFILLLAWLNLRGIKESIKILIPVFMAFLISNGGLIVYGLITHASRMPAMVQSSMGDAKHMIGELGWVVMASFVLRAYSLGAGTYTGIEAVSNNVHLLAEPRVRTGKLTMLYMAISLSIIAGGITILYLLWDVVPVAGKTLNAVTFSAMTEHWSIMGFPLTEGILTFSMASAAGLLFVAANTGLAAGPVVLANMAADDWMPRYFSHLSSRLVTDVGIGLMTIAALILLFVTRGNVSVLVVLYSINVFITFALCLLGLTVHWVRRLAHREYNFGRLFISGVGFLFSFSILIVLVIEKFALGGWISLGATALLVLLCLGIKHHYKGVNRRLAAIDEELSVMMSSRRKEPVEIKEIDYKAPTAALIIGSEYGAGMHTLLWIERMFPGHFKNYVFLTVGEVDAQSYGAEEELTQLKDEVAMRLGRFEKFCQVRGLGTASYYAFGTDVPQELVVLAQKAATKFSNIVAFAPKLMLPRENWFIRLLHNQTALAVQRRLHMLGLPMMILPMNLE